MWLFIDPLQLKVITVLREVIHQQVVVAIQVDQAVAAVDIEVARDEAAHIKTHTDCLLFSSFFSY